MTMDQLALGDFAPTLDSKLSQYHTPTKLCRRIVEWAGIYRGMSVLEPSAGGGNFVRELLRVEANVTALEIDPRWSNVLRKEFPEALVCTGDFLKFSNFGFDTDVFVGERPFAISVMNPPLDEGVGAHHVRHALRLAPRAVSILRGQDLHCKERYKKLWSDCDLAGLVCLVQRPVYCGKGGQIETVVVDVRRKGTFTGQQKIEHWAGAWS